MLHTYTPYPMSLPSINFLHLTVSEIQPGQTFSRRPPIWTPWVKTIPQQPLRIRQDFQIQGHYGKVKP